MNGIWAEEETLMTDEDGVYRDPNLHFDGQHLLFSWKKSAKEDDFHLYEMDLKTRDIKQLTFGKGHADIEGIYLPDENILFNSTRCGSAVDCWFTEVSNMYLCDREGRYMHLVETYLAHIALLLHCSMTVVSFIPVGIITTADRYGHNRCSR